MGEHELECVVGEQVGFGASQTVRDSRGGTVSGAASLLQGGIVDKIKSGLQMFTIAGLPFVVELPAVCSLNCSPLSPLSHGPISLSSSHTISHSWLLSSSVPCVPVSARSS